MVYVCMSFILSIKSDTNRVERECIIIDQFFGGIYYVHQFYCKQRFVALQYLIKFRLILKIEAEMSLFGLVDCTRLSTGCRS